MAIFALGTFIASEYLELPDIPVAVPAFLGTAISLVLAFKLSHSYERWWEARIIWGAIVNDSRSLMIQVLNFTGGKERAISERIGYRQIAWCYSLGQSLRRQDPMESLAGNISDEEINKIEGISNVPMALIDRHAADIAYLHRNGTINDFQQIQLDDTLVRLCASMGKAERIKNTIFPTAYRYYLHLSVYLFLGLLSVSIAEYSGLWQVFILILVSLPFLVLEKTSVYLQDPFENLPTDTPVTSIARTIEINIRQLLEEVDVPEPVRADGFFVM